MLFTLLVVIVTVTVKLWLAWDVRASAMFSDDYAYLNKSIFYIHGQWDMPGYIFQNVFAGILYPLLISPWMLFDTPEARIFTVWVVNALLSGVTVWFGALAVGRATGRRFWPAPICLAVFVPTFLFSFVAMTENLVFPLLAFCAWLAADFDNTLRSRWRFTALCAAVAALPLVRAPGLAAGLALALLCLPECRRLGWIRAILRALALIAATLGPYLLLMGFAPAVNTLSDAKREDAYVDALGDILGDPWKWWIVVLITLSQLKYVMIATGGFSLPTYLATFFLRKPQSALAPRPQVRHLRNFVTLCSLGMLGIAELHIIRKIHFEVGGADIIFGRYMDPIALMILIAGVAALTTLRRARLHRAGVVLIRYVAPLALALSIGRVWNDPEISSFNQTGLAGFCGQPDYPLASALIGMGALAVIFQLPTRRKWFARACVVAFAGWSVFSIDRGLNTYVLPRAELIARSQEAASWLATHTAKDVRVGFDRRVFRDAAPTWRTMGLHYQALIFAMHPRGYGFVGDNDTLRQFDYLFTSARRAPTPRLPVAWTNGDYTLYRVVEGVSVYAPNEKSPLDAPASPDILLAESADAATAPDLATPIVDLRDLVRSCCPATIRFDDCAGKPAKIKNNPKQLTLAWKNSTVYMPRLLLSPGRYSLVVRARADGCEDDPARLHVSAGDLADIEWAIGRGAASCYRAEFMLDTEADVTFELHFTNNGMCGPPDRQVDKNIYIESINLLPIIGPSPLLD